MKLHQKLRELSAAVAAEGGRLFVVGGWVRDIHLERMPGDVDCEVHLLRPERLMQLLNQEGAASKVGRSFGVYKWAVSGECFDIHLVESALSLEKSVEKAIERRDFCCNALLFDPLTDQVLDRVGGLADIEAGRLRAVHSSRFGEDPLRAIRGPRFAATLGFTMDAEAEELCRTQDLSGLPGERIWGEFYRILTGSFPERGWELLGKLGLLQQLFPDCSALSSREVGTRLRWLRGAVPSLEPPGLVVVQLTLATVEASEPQLNQLFERLRLDRVEGVSLRRSMRGLRDWLQWVEGHGMGDEALLHLSEFCPVHWGVAVFSALKRTVDPVTLMERARILGVEQGPLPALLSGQDLLEVGVDAGPEVGRLLAKLRSRQLAGTISDRMAALEWLERELSLD